MAARPVPHHLTSVLARKAAALPATGKVAFFVLKAHMTSQSLIGGQPCLLAALVAAEVAAAVVTQGQVTAQLSAKNLKGRKGW